MGLGAVLGGARARVLERWFRAVADTYPAEASRSLAAVDDPFANPLGHELRAGLARLYDLLAAGAAPDLRAAADGIVRIRAVQGFAPSEAVGFVHALRGILREELAGVPLDAAAADALDRGVDRLALAAFDVYMACRERIFEIRVRELRGSRA